MEQPDQPLFALFLQQQPQLQQAAEAVAAANQWQDKYRLLMQAGKLLPQLPPQWQQDTARVSGCESAVWLYHLQQQQRHLYLADSDARVVRGLIALLLAGINNASATELAAFSAETYFAHLGLAGQLSPSRSNGLYAIVDTMKNLSK
jgi:cysteine desulfuration protein SufE